MSEKERLGEGGGGFARCSPLAEGLQWGRVAFGHDAHKKTSKGGDCEGMAVWSVAERIALAPN
eukprot:1040308-Amphidinium_carterae.1